MKHLILLLLITCCIVCFHSCDKIDEPYGSRSNIISDRKVLIEDFTGHTCQACPNAHRKASDLLNNYGKNLVVIAIHAGYFAEPNPNPNSNKYKYDFRNPLSTQIATDFGIINEPLPKGMVNRMLDSTTGNRLVLEWATWADQLKKWYTKPADAAIVMSSTFDSSSRNISVNVNVNVINDLINNSKLAVYFIEDSIVKWQKDGSSDVEFYVHNHVLRGSLNGTYGQDLGILEAGDEINRNYYGPLTPADAVPKNVKLVAILTNALTKEVIQVEEIELQ